MNGNSAPNYKPIKLDFNSGVWSAKDPASIPPNNLAEGVNIQLTDQYSPSKCFGRQKYNSSQTGTNTPVNGMIAFIGEDGNEYIIKACNNKLYWSKGDGTFTAVKYANENVDITLDTTNQWINFVLFDKTISAVLKKVVYVLSAAYPVSTNANGTNNTKCSTSKSLRLQLASAVVVGYNVFAGTGGGSDDVAVGNGSTTISWPQSGKYGCKVLNRVLVANYAAAANGYITSEAADSENWTNSGISSNTGGGTYPEAFTGCVAVDSRVFIFSRHSILVVNAVPGPLTSWREYFVPTQLGNVGQQIVIHSDGWVYYISEEGLARTNGSIAERVDYSIEDQIKNLSQLKNSLYSWFLNTKTDWDAGTIGSQQFDTTNSILIQKAQTTKADWDAGVATLVDTATSPGDVIVTPISSIAQGAYNSTALCQGLTQYAQLIFPPTTGTLYSVTLSLSRTAVFAGTFYCELCSNNGGVPSASPLDVSTVGIGSIIQEPGVQTNTFVFTGGVVLSASTYYWLRFRVVDGAQVYVRISTLAPYVNGNLASTTDGGNNWTQEVANDAYFIVQQYNPIGNIVTQFIDYGTTPTTLGNLAANVTLPTGTTIHFYGETATTSGGFVGTYVDLGTASATGNYTNSLSGLTIRRYLKIKAVLTASTSGATPILSSINIGGQYITFNKDLAVVPFQWGIFSSAYDSVGETLTFEMAVSSDNFVSDIGSYVAITPGNIPTNTLKRYVRFRFTFDTTDYTKIPYITSFTLNFFKTSANKTLPTIWSYKDRLFAAFSSNGSSVNDHCWVGETKPVQGIAYQASLLTQIVYPIWNKRDFIAANVFGVYGSQLISGNSSQGFVDYEDIGNTNRGSAFTSYFTTGAISVDDVAILLRFMYAHYKASTVSTVQWRTRIGANDWSAYSTALTLPAVVNESRSAKMVPPAPIVQGDYIQLKFQNTNTDSTWFINFVLCYIGTYAQGR